MGEKGNNEAVEKALRNLLGVAWGLRQLLDEKSGCINTVCVNLDFNNLRQRYEKMKLEKPDVVDKDKSMFRITLEANQDSRLDVAKTQDSILKYLCIVYGDSNMGLIDSAFVFIDIFAMVLLLIEEGRMKSIGVFAPDIEMDIMLKSLKCYSITTQTEIRVTYPSLLRFLFIDVCHFLYHQYVFMNVDNKHSGNLMSLFLRHMSRGAANLGKEGPDPPLNPPPPLPPLNVRIRHCISPVLMKPLSWFRVKAIYIVDFIQIGMAIKREFDIQWYANNTDMLSAGWERTILNVLSTSISHVCCMKMLVLSDAGMNIPLALSLAFGAYKAIAAGIHKGLPTAVVNIVASELRSLMSDAENHYRLGKTMREQESLSKQFVMIMIKAGAGGRKQNRLTDLEVIGHFLGSVNAYGYVFGGIVGTTVGFGSYWLYSGQKNKVYDRSTARLHHLFLPLCGSFIRHSLVTLMIIMHKIIPDLKDSCIMEIKMVANRQGRGYRVAIRWDEGRFRDSGPECPFDEEEVDGFFSGNDRFTTYYDEEDKIVQNLPKKCASFFGRQKDLCNLGRNEIINPTWCVTNPRECLYVLRNKALGAPERKSTEMFTGLREVYGYHNDFRIHSFDADGKRLSDNKIKLHPRQLLYFVGKVFLECALLSIIHEIPFPSLTNGVLVYTPIGLTLPSAAYMRGANAALTNNITVTLGENERIESENEWTPTRVAEIKKQVCRNITDKNSDECNETLYRNSPEIFDAIMAERIAEQFHFLLQPGVNFLNPSTANTLSNSILLYASKGFYERGLGITDMPRSYRTYIADVLRYIPGFPVNSGSVLFRPMAWNTEEYIKKWTNAVVREANNGALVEAEREALVAKIIRYDTGRGPIAILTNGSLIAGIRHMAKDMWDNYIAGIDLSELKTPVIGVATTTLVKYFKSLIALLNYMRMAFSKKKSLHYAYKTITWLLFVAHFSFNYIAFMSVSFLAYTALTACNHARLIREYNKHVNEMRLESREPISFVRFLPIQPPLMQIMMNNNKRGDPDIDISEIFKSLQKTIYSSLSGKPELKDFTWSILQSVFPFLRDNEFNYNAYGWSLKYLEAHEKEMIKRAEL